MFRGFASRATRLGASTFFIRRSSLPLSKVNQTFTIGIGKGVALSASLAMGMAGVTTFSRARLENTEQNEMSLSEFDAKVKSVKQAFASSEEDCLLVGGLIDSIKVGDYLAVQLSLEALKYKNINIDPLTFRSLIHLTAMAGRVKALELFAEYFGAENVRSVALARELLDHPMRNEIEEIAGQFMKGLGNIKEDGERVYLEYMADKEKSNLEASPNLQADGLDLESDFLAMIRFLREENKVKVRNDAKLDAAEYLNNTVVLSEFSNELLYKYLVTLKSRVNEQGPTYGNFIIAGGHFVAADIQLEKTKTGIKATLLYFDSLGNTATYDNFAPYVSTMLQVFPETEFYSAEAKLQYSFKGCSIFTLLNRGYISYIDLLRNYPQYDYQNVPVRKILFEYARDHVTERIDGEFPDDNGFSPYQYNLFLTPVYMEAPKQTFTQRGVVNEISRNKDGIFNEYKTMRVGHMGLFVQKAHLSSYDLKRYQEFGQITNPKQESFEEYVGRYTIKHELKGIEKNTNGMVQKKCAQFGIRIARWLVKKSPAEVAAIINASHTLASMTR